MSQVIARSNVYYPRRRSRGANRVFNQESRKMGNIILAILICLSVVLLHQYLCTQTTVLTSQIATCQKVRQDLQNQEEYFKQEIESLKDPQRIERLALAMGMSPPCELKNDKHYSVQYASLSYQGTIKMASSANAGNALPLSEIHPTWRKGVGLWLAKLATYYQRAEAHPGK